MATGAACRSKGRSICRERHVRPWSAVVPVQTRVPRPGPAAASRRSYHVTPSRPSPATASVGRNGCAASSTTAEAALQVRPPSLDPLVQMADVPSWRFSNQAAYAQPWSAAATTSCPNARIVLPLSGSVVCVIAKDATVTGGAQVRPPSVERSTPTSPWWFVSSGAPCENTSRRTPEVGITSSLFCVCTGPRGVMKAGSDHVTPWSSLRENVTWSVLVLTNRAQTAYTRPGRDGSARIDSLSSTACDADALATTTGAAQVCPPSREALTTM